MKRLLFILLACVITLSAKSQDYLHYYTTDKGDSTGTATSTKLMTETIHKSALYYKQYAPVPRFAQLDYAFGADIKEYNLLAGNGVLYIPSLNRDETEYPVKRVYAKTSKGVVELTKIGEIKVGNTDPDIVDVFGKNRVDYYYLLPYWLTREKCELLIDWSINRKEFVLAKFPDESTLEFEVPKLSGQALDQKFLNEFLKREFGVGAGKR